MHTLPTRLARYEPLDTLSEGPGSTVRLARDRKLDRLVAIKTLRGSPAVGGTNPPGSRDALPREATLAQLLSHPSIVKVHDVITLDGDPSPSLVMEYVPGSTLATYLMGNQPLPMDFAVEMVSQLSEALDHAHSMGVVHGDIKPSNILICEDGARAKLVDFGIAHRIGDAEASSDPPHGTPRYLAPEQLTGGKSTVRTDIFALGLVFYEMLTGKTAFAGETPKEVADSVRDCRIDWWAPALQSAPQEILGILDRCLAKDPNQRFDSARQLYQTLLSSSDPSNPPDTTLQTQDLTELVVPELPELSPPGPGEKGELSGYYRVVNGHASWRRWLFLCSITTATTVCGGLLITRVIEPPANYDLRPSEQHRGHLQLTPLLQEAHRLADDGEHELAARVFERAEELAPERRRIAGYKSTVEERQKAELEQDRAARRVQALYEQGRGEVARGRLDSVWSIIQQIRLEAPDAPEADSLESLARELKSTKTPESHQVADAENLSSQPDQFSVLPRLDQARQVPQQAPLGAGTKAPQPNAELVIDVFSYLSKGVLTVYVGPKQVYLEPFRFVQKSGFLRKKKSAGRLETSVLVPESTGDLRIYVSREGQEARSVTVPAQLTPGQSHSLRIVISEDGSPTAEFD